jgi:hypothetical protein
MDFSKLKIPFDPCHIRWRVSRAGYAGNSQKIWARVLAYVTSRAIMDRLDDVCGPENWRNEYKEGPGGGVLCGLSIRTGGEWITKWDGAENTNFEAVKGGLSGSLKRAGYQWGIGRYLYNLEEEYAIVTPSGEESGSFKVNGDGGKKKDVYFKYNPPELPDWALPKGYEPNKAREVFEELIKEIQKVVTLDSLENWIATNKQAVNDLLDANYKKKLNDHVVAHREFIQEAIDKEMAGK